MSESERFRRRALNGAVFEDCAMAGARFDDVNLGSAAFTNVNLRGARFDDVNLSDVAIDNANIHGLRIFGQDIHALLVPDEPRMSVEAQLFVTDLDRARAFYEGKLGFKLVFSYGDPPFYAQVARAGARLNLRHVDEPVFAPGFREREADALSAIVTLDDIRPLFREFQDAGVAFHQPLRDKPWGARTFIVVDPDQNLLAFADGATTRTF